MSSSSYFSRRRTKECAARVLIQNRNSLGERNGLESCSKYLRAAGLVWWCRTRWFMDPSVCVCAVRIPDCWESKRVELSPKNNFSLRRAARQWKTAAPPIHTRAFLPVDFFPMSLGGAEIKHINSLVWLCVRVFSVLCGAKLRPLRLFSNPPPLQGKEQTFYIHDQIKRGAECNFSAALDFIVRNAIYLRFAGVSIQVVVICWRWENYLRKRRGHCAGNI